MILKWLMMARCFDGLQMFPRVTPNIVWYDFITRTLCTQKAIAPLLYGICLTHAFLIACFLASWTSHFFTASKGQQEKKNTIYHDDGKAHLFVGRNTILDLCCISISND